MNIINLIKDFITRKKLLRYSMYFKKYDLNRELALFIDTPLDESKLENKNKEQYEVLISVMGAGGRSGSTVINDFLAEFSEATSLGGGHSSKTMDDKNIFECTFWGMDDGILDLEERVFSHKINRHATPFCLNILKNYHSGVWIFDDYYLQRSKKFLLDLIECHWRWSRGVFHPLGTTQKEKLKNDLPYDISSEPARIEKEDPKYNQIIGVLWKQMNRAEFRAKAREYIQDFLKHIPSKKYLVCSRLLCIGRHDEELFNDYFGDVKTIFVWRDPRDQYTRVRRRFSSAQPKDPFVYCKRHKTMMERFLNIKSKNLLMIRYEEFITDYEKVSKQIMDFLGLDPAKHVDKFKYFDPKVSAEKIGCYKDYEDQEAIKILERELKEYCWEK